MESISSNYDPRKLAQTLSRNQKSRQKKPLQQYLNELNEQLPKSVERMYRNKKRYERDAIEGNSRFRKALLDYIYIRDHGICLWCELPVDRNEASREHLFRPLKDYPHLGKNALYQALVHRSCNR